jgi:hypothetical protein
MLVVLRVKIPHLHGGFFFSPCVISAVNVDLRIHRREHEHGEQTAEVLKEPIKLKASPAFFPQLC